MLDLQLYLDRAIMKALKIGRILEVLTLGIFLLVNNEDVTNLVVGNQFVPMQRTNRVLDLIDLRNRLLNWDMVVLRERADGDK